MSKELKCPMCQSTDIETYKDNPDDKGMCWHTYHECRKCGRTCRDYDWLKLTDYEKETIKTKMLTAEVERLKAELENAQQILKQLVWLYSEENERARMWELTIGGLSPTEWMADIVAKARKAVIPTEDGGDNWFPID